MKKNLFISLKLTLVMIVLLAVLYPLFISLVAKAAPGGGGGEKLMLDGKVVGYANVGQKFTEDKYFWGRPSAVDYNAAGSGGSNKGTSNPDYILTISARIDSFLAHNPTLKKEQIPGELITSSGSGLDPDISPAGAMVQVDRVARVRMISVEKIKELVNKQTEKPLFGPAHVNVLKLNIELVKLKGN